MSAALPAAARPPVPERLRFGRFELQAAQHRLLVDGQPATLGSRALDLLAVLATEPDRLISKGELLDRVWPGLVVEEANLHVQISNLRKVLGGELIATVPGRGYRFTGEPQSVPGTTPAAAAPAAAAASAASASAPAVAPAAATSRLFGRADDRRHLTAALLQPGCVTLVGPAGVGKTSLAREAVPAWNGPAVWADLAQLTDASQLPATLARAAGATTGDGDPHRMAVEALQGPQQLLVLDNAEHLVDACAQLVTRLLQDLPRLHLLVTSQLPLQVAGERVQRLQPLPPRLPPPGSDAGWGDGAVGLLVERIVAADHRIPLGPQALPLLQAVCEQLDGLPLALEMAAARVPLLGLQGVHDGLAQRFALLSGGLRSASQRHRTLHQALDWSYGLLTSEEQRLFRGLGQFAGPFTLDQAVALMAPQDKAPAAPDADRWVLIDRLAVLVDRSLVTTSGADAAAPRYGLLETMRAYAREQLAAQGEQAALHRRHAQTMQAQLDAVVPRDPAGVTALMADVQAAVLWAGVHDWPLAVALTTRASNRGTFTTWRITASQWMEALEPRMRSDAGQALPVAVQTGWWTEHARGLVMRTHARAVEVAQHTCDLARRHDHPDLVWGLVALVRALADPGPTLDAACAELQALMEAHPEWSVRVRLAAAGALGAAADRRDNRPARLVARRRELALAREAGNPHLVDTVESNVVAALVDNDQLDDALAMARPLVQRLSGTGSANLPWAWNGLLSTLQRLGRQQEVRQLLPQALADVQPMGDAWLLQKQLAWLVACEGHHALAARLTGHLQALFEASNMDPVHQREHLAEVLLELQPAMSDAQRERLAAEGRGWTLTQAQAAALNPG